METKVLNPEVINVVEDKPGLLLNSQKHALPTSNSFFKPEHSLNPEVVNVVEDKPGLLLNSQKHALPTSKF